MGLFNLSDITVNAPKEATGPLGILNNTQYALNTFRYPEDLSSSDKGHYMVININEQRLTSYKDPEGPTNQTPTAISNNQTFGSFAAGTGNLLQTFGAAVEQHLALPLLVLLPNHWVLLLMLVKVCKPAVLELKNE